MLQSQKKITNRLRATMNVLTSLAKLYHTLLSKTMDYCPDNIIHHRSLKLRYMLYLE